MTTPLSAAQLERLRRDAKELARKKSLRLWQAQQELATQRGYPNWSLLVKASKAVKAVEEQRLRRMFDGEVKAADGSTFGWKPLLHSRHVQEPAKNTSGHHCKECTLK